MALLELALSDLGLALLQKIHLELAPSDLGLVSLELWLAHIDLELGPSDLGLAPLKLQLALSHKIDLELTPSYLGLSSSQKVIDLRLAPLHTIRVRLGLGLGLGLRLRLGLGFKNSPTSKIPQLVTSLLPPTAPPKTAPNDPSYTTRVSRLTPH